MWSESTNGERDSLTRPTQFSCDSDRAGSVEDTQSKRVAGRLAGREAASLSNRADHRELPWTRPQRCLIMKLHSRQRLMARLIRNRSEDCRVGQESRSA